MRKLFLLAAMCCLVMNSWADCQLIGDEIPSGTGVNARSIINIQYDQETQTLSFRDVYEPTFTAYERLYKVYFYRYSEDYAFYKNPSGGYSPVMYGAGCGAEDDAFIPSGRSASSSPEVNYWISKSVPNSAGGWVTINLSDITHQISALGANHVMVGILPSYKISATASDVEYSVYGEYHYWLMNTAHFKLSNLIDRMYALVTRVVTPQGFIGTGPGSPFKSAHHVYICEGQDTAKLQVNIYPTAGVSASVSYFWQYRVDDETTWKMKGSKSSFTKTAWNNAVSDKSPLFANRNFHYNLGDMERVTYFRLALVYDNDTLYSDEIQIDARFRAQISGPVGADIEGVGYRICQLKGTYPHYYFDTISFSVTSADTILLLPLRSKSDCSISIPIGGSIITDSKGRPCITDIWYSCIIKPSVERHSVKLYVDGGIYANFDKVFCGYTPYECNYSLTDPAIPNVVWKDRATGKAYLGSKLMEMCIVEDMEFDAVSVEKYNLYIRGDQVTTLNCADILGDGKVSYDPATKTLYLTNADLNGTYNSSAVVAVYDSITIHCAGTTNAISIYSYSKYAAISEDAGHVTITGNAELAMFVQTGNVLDLHHGLTINGGCRVIAARTSPKPYATINLGGGVLTVDEASLEADGSTLAPTIANCGGLVLNNAKITSGHTYDATTHKFLNAAGEEATDGIMIKPSTAKYNLFVKGEQVTFDNCSDILGDGTMSYNDDTKTLTLNNANITYEEEHILSVHQDLVINCVGTNTFIATGANNGIEEFGGDVTITGSGSLSINSDDGAAIYTQNDLTIQDGCVVTVQTDNQYAIELSGGTLTVEGATLIAKGNGTNPTIIECDELIMLNGVAIRTAHTYDAATHQFLNAAGEEAKDDIIIGVEGTDLEELTMDDAQGTVKKMIIDNQLLIRHNGKLYNALGGRVK